MQLVVLTCFGKQTVPIQRANVIPWKRVQFQQVKKCWSSFNVTYYTNWTRVRVHWNCIVSVKYYCYFMSNINMKDIVKHWKIQNNCITCSVCNISDICICIHIMIIIIIILNIIMCKWIDVIFQHGLYNWMSSTILYRAIPSLLIPPLKRA